MKCPKCSYISFDYNASCPKCNKDVTTEARKLNLPPYKPNPPSLLGTLSGETDESYANLLRNTYTGPVPDEPNLDVGLDDSSEIGGGDRVFDDGQDLDIDFGSGEFDTSGPTEPEPAQEEDEHVYSLDDLKLDETGELKIGDDSKLPE